MRTDFLNDPWFAGFVDGEGCFDLPRTQMRFSIGLRVDDQPILEALQGVFGGRLYPTPLDRRRCQWHVNSRSEIAELIRYFDRFPLRSKKAHDYEVWRKAFQVLEEKGPRAAEFATLKAELRDGRRYATVH